MSEQTYRYWEKILVRKLDTLWKKSDKFLPCHGPDHHLRVWENAKPFGLKKGADMEVLLAGCLFHDVSSFNRAAPENHDIDSARIAKRLLKKVGFPEQKIKLVEAAILYHRSNVIGGGSLEGKILKSFDKIDAFGPIGVYRIITPLSIRGYTAGDIAGFALSNQKLKTKWQSITFPELRRKYRARYRYTKRYFEDLLRELGLPKTHKTTFTEKRIYAK